jgi:hypothetical protein
LPQKKAQRAQKIDLKNYSGPDFGVIPTFAFLRFFAANHSEFLSDLLPGE